MQGPGLGYPGLGPHHVYEEDEDGAADSLATDTDLPSLYSVPHKLRSESRSATGELLALVYKSQQFCVVYYIAASVSK